MARARRSETTLGLGMGALALLVLILTAAVGPGEAAKAKQARPNIVQVMTDDQTVESMRVMPKVRSLLGNQGVTFRNSFVSFALCCPSRATWLTGQYAHNHGVRGNASPGGGYDKLDGSRTLPVWLRRSGYYTAHVGKYLNGYGRAPVPDTEVPPGWSEWRGSLDDPDGFTGGTYTMYGYTLNENRQVVHYGSTPDVVDPATYQTDVYSAKAEAVIRARAPQGKPFYLSVAPLAPHGEGGGVCDCANNNPRAAPRHEGDLAAEALPQPPNFNEADVSDKPAEIRNLTLMNQNQIDAARNRYRARIESLLAVDEMVANLVDALKDTGELNRTVVIFTSDNGFFHGEHRVRNGKVRVYEPSVRVPLIVRGPGFPRGVVRKQLTTNADLAATALDLADAKADRKLDGTSLLPLAKDPRRHPGRGLLLETFFNAAEETPDDPPNRYRAVRTDRYKYVLYGTGEQELYDLRADPSELQSRHADPAYAAVRARLSSLLGRLRNCDARICRSRPALRLRTRFQRGPGGCVDSDVRTRVIGKQRKQGRSARFFVGSRRAGRDFKRPLRRNVGRAKLRRKGKNRIRAIVTVLDGRRTTVSKRIPRRC